MQSQNGGISASRARVPPPPARPISSSIVARHSQEVSGQRLAARVQHLSQLVQTFREFERSKNVQVLKDFLRVVTADATQSNQKMLQLFDQQFDLKQREQRGSGSVAIEAKEEQLRQLEELKQENQRLQRQMHQERQLEETLRMRRRGVVDRVEAEAQLTNLSHTAQQLQTQIEHLQRQNTRLAESLTRKAFFKQYEFVWKECQGIQRQNEKLNEYTKKWKDQLTKLNQKKPEPQIKTESQPSENPYRIQQTTTSYSKFTLAMENGFSRTAPDQLAAGHHNRGAATVGANFPSSVRRFP